MKSSSLGAVFAFGLVSGACSATTDEDPLVEEGIGSVQQPVGPLQLPTFVNISKFSTTGTAIAECPSGAPNVMGAGAGFSSSKGYTSIFISGPTFCPPPCTPTGTEVWAARPNDVGSVTAIGTCSSASSDQYWAWDTDGDKTVNCPEGEVAVGGGGFCDDPGAKLFRSRPNPDTHLSKPKGWRASCTSGGVSVEVSCVLEESTYDFSGCYTKRSDDDDAGENVSCASGDYAVGVGAYCGGSYIDYMNMGSGMVAVGCRANTVHAYAVCCPDN